jgi:hypothetical protein
MGTNGEAQYYAADLADAYRILYTHYRFSYVVPGETGPPTARPRTPRAPVDGPVPEGTGDFSRVAEIFDEATNPGAQAAVPMRAVMAALIDHDGGCLERWRSWAGAGTAIVWDAHLGGVPICLIGIESQNVLREGIGRATVRRPGTAARSSHSPRRRSLGHSTPPAAIGPRWCSPPSPASTAHRSRCASCSSSTAPRSHARW